MLELRRVPSQPFTSLLEQNYQNLTVLAVKVKHESMLRTILKTCRNLTHLICEQRQYEYRSSTDVPGLPEQPLKLTHLQPQWDDDDSAISILSSVLPHCPELKFFATTVETLGATQGKSRTLTGRRMDNVFSLLRQWCSSLVQFWVVDKDYLFQLPRLCFECSSPGSIISLVMTAHLEEE